MGVMIAPFPLCAESDRQPPWGRPSLRARKRLMHCNIIDEIQTERPPRAAVSPLI